VEEQQSAAAALPSKGEALRLLPPGTHVSLTRRADGSWTGTLSAHGTKVEGTGDAGAGPQAVIVWMARRWLSETAAAADGLEH
jgi:hypothetical protein